MEKENIFIEKLSPLTKNERLIAFYKSQKFADCTFRINGTEIMAHKLILACSSPVFEKMFYGELVSDEVIISDIDAKEFRQVLEFIYTEHISISTIVHAWSLFSIAHKYLLDELAQVCLSYIQENVTMNSLMLSYEYADMYSLHNIKNKFLSDIVSYVNWAFCNDYHMKASTLCAILEKDVDLEKCDLVMNILNWATIECDFKKILVTPENIIDILTEEGILKHVKKGWISNFKCNDCSYPLVMCHCLDELLHKSILLLDDILLGTEECSNRKSIQCAPSICRLRKEYKIASRVDMSNGEEHVSSFSANRDMVVFGFLVRTEMNPSGLFQCKYEGSVRVRVCELNTKVNICKPATFRGFMCYDSDVYVSFKDVLVLEKHVPYDIRISYKNYNRLGVRPVHYYYMANKLVDDHKDSVIKFYEMIGTLVKGLAFYPA